MSSSDNNTKYYDILGVSKENFLQEDLNKAYKKAVLKNHPCIGGDPDELMESYRAYQILRDPEKRQLYDQYGENAVKNLVDGVPFYDIDDLPRVTQRRGKDLVFPLKVSLQDLYNGKSYKVSLERNVLCSKCNGKGTKPSVSINCPGCQGCGMKLSVGQLGPGMIQQMLNICHECNGIGEYCDDRCPSCKGEKVVSVKDILEVYVEKGMQIGHKITFPGQADEAPDTITGDIVLILQAKG
ncbi:hypothetical protein AQUCO_00500004v1 [Aquilegia coerulea]|uniref:J domain-containing protein n=1 Tax=Aquilegia coerulea TaxID=218851 RepID=A0A2G5EQ07_AQUCA|nr:hypothetical protein AQUCO_00500004v1 [Aquilegia coerulea]